MPPDAVGQRKFYMLIEAMLIRFDQSRYVVRVDSLNPTIPKLFVEGASGEVEPTAIEVGARFLWSCHPDQHRSRVCNRAKPSFSLSQPQFHMCAISNINNARNDVFGFSRLGIPD